MPLRIFIHRLLMSKPDDQITNTPDQEYPIGNVRLSSSPATSPVSVLLLILTLCPDHPGYYTICVRNDRPAVYGEHQSASLPFGRHHAYIRNQ